MIQILDRQTGLLTAIFDNTLVDPSKPELGKWYREDVHKESINNFETFDFTANARIPEAKELKGLNRVLIKGDGGGDDWREFVIFFTHREGGEIEVRTNGSYTEMAKDKIIMRFENVAENAQDAMEYGLNGTEWQPGIIEYGGIRTIKSDDVLDPYSYLLLVAREFDMQLVFRVVVRFNKVVGRYVDLLHNVGADNGKEIIMGKDLVRITREEDSDRIVTALVVEGPEKQPAEDGTGGGRVTVTVSDEAARQRWGIEGRHRWGYHRVESDNTEMLAPEVTTYGRRELNKRLESVVTYKADAVSIEHIFGFSHEKVLKGDKVRIKDTSYSPPLYMEARVIDIERKPSAPKMKTYVLGEIIEYSENEVMATFRKLRDELNGKLGREEVEQIVIGDRQVVYSAIPPENPSLNLLWMDTSRSPNALFRWDGGQWIKASATDAADIGAETPEGAAAKVTALRNEIVADLGELSEAQTTFENTVNTTFKDGIISTAEAQSIAAQQNLLKAEKSDVDSQYTKIYSNSFLSGTPKTNLASAKTAFNTAHANLLSAITAAITDGQATTAERDLVNSRFTTHNTALATLSTRFSEALDSIGQTQAQSFSNQSAVITKLQMELNTISETLRELGVESTELNNNTFLQNNPVLTTLNTRKNTMNTEANELVSAINAGILDGILTQTEDALIAAKRTDYRIAVDEMIKIIRLAEDEILRVRTNEVIEFGEKKIHKGLNVPQNPMEGDLWVDPFESPPIWRQYKNAAWVNLTRTNLSDMQGQITQTQVADNAISTPQLAANAVTAKHIAANVITSTMITTAGLDAGVITYGTMTGITADVGQAGMTAVGTTATSVRFWAGALYASRGTAPFRVLQNGRVYASDLWIEGGSINVSTDIRVGNNLYLGSDQTNRYDPRKLAFNDGAYIRGGGGAYGAAIELGAEYMEDLTADWHYGYGFNIKNGFYYSTVDFTVDADVNTIIKGPLTASGPEWKRTLSEKGWLGFGGNSTGVTGPYAYGAAMFRMKKTYVPSSISLQVETVGGDGNTNLITNAINVDGFFIYFTSLNTSIKNSYWRGWYTA